ncbi:MULTISPECIES: sugar transferase [unclassified Microbacterium]|uniref:sugar transferase n=1 Tax=unclassified Microbacterium TaxID=2609290 RepID=UPI00386EAA09
MTSSAAATSLDVALTPRLSADAARRLRQRSRHRLRLVVGDAVAVAMSVGGAAPLWREAHLDRTALLPGALALALLFLIALSVARSAAAQLTVADEARRVAAAAAATFALGASIVAVAPSATGRALLICVVPLALALVGLGRLYWRTGAPRGQRPREPRTVLVGDRAALEALLPALGRDARLGFDVIGTTLVGSDATPALLGPGDLPLLGPAESTAAVARSMDADTVIVVGATPEPDFVRRLSWQLEGTAITLLLATTLTDVVAGRMTLRRSTGLALVGIRVPTYDGAQHRVKRVLDVVTASLALVPIAVLTPLIVLVIRLDSAGPALFRQRRVGRDGREFDMLKFRTMRVTAEAELEAMAGQNEASGALFKLRQDPRITRVGRVLRKYSIDELPQFWNVLRGDMSVVGPRPPLPREVRLYDVPVFRRLYLRPGITGPWQIGGRSDLSWDDTVRLDLHYVENWSVACDLGIMLRTAGVVLRAKGAY